MYKQKITIYRCEYCSKHYHNSPACKKHEDDCLFNPDKKACGSCIFAEHGYIKCGLTGNKLDTTKPIKNCSDHTTQEQHEDEIEECKR